MRFLRTEVLAASLSYKARRLLGMPAGMLEAAAARTWTIAPSQVVRALKPLVRDDHLARIRASTPGRTAESVVAAVRAETHVLSPTMAYELHDVYLADDCLYCGRFKYDLNCGRGFPKYLLSAEVAELDCVGLADTYSGSKWFGHWLTDELPRQCAVQEIAQPVAHIKPVYGHEPAYRKAFRLEAPTRYRGFYAKRLVVVHEIENADKARRYRRLREASKVPASGNSRVFLMRGRTGETRTLVNEIELAERLRNEGFTIVDPSRLSLEEIMRQCMGASIVVGVEGSHMTHAFFFARHNALLIALVPPYRATEIIPVVGSFFGLAGAMYVCEPVDGLKDRFTADADSVTRFLEDAVQMHAARGSAVDEFLDGLFASNPGAHPDRNIGPRATSDASEATCR